MNNYQLIDFRKATSEDLEVVFNFERLYILEHEPDQIDQWEMAKSKMMDLLTHNIPRMFVAVKNREVVGHSYWSIFEEKPCIYSIYVRNETRRQGIAGELLKKCEESILESGYDQVILSTLEFNGAQHVFEKMSYRKIGIKDGWIQYEKMLKGEEK